MQVEISVGEIVDKLSILEIKKDNVFDQAKLSNITKEFNYLYEVVFNQLQIEFIDYNKLVEVNRLLWKIEDDIRDKEHRKEFDKEFAELARSVYITNDRRADIKKEINIKYNSLFIEEKSYNQY